MTEVIYNVTVVTGGGVGAGTDNDVFITINGADGSSGEIQLNAANNTQKKEEKALFEANQSDIFDVKSPKALGKLISVTIRCPKSAGFSMTGYDDWTLSNIVITGGNLTAPAKFTFPKKISSSEPVTVPVDVPLASAAANATGPKYRVTVKTGTSIGAGTDANITLTLYGNANETAVELKHALCITPERKTQKDLFENGNTDVFEFQGPDLGSSLTKIKVNSDDSGVGSDWGMESITVEGGNLSKPVTFSYSGGLIRKDPVELYPGDNTPVKGNASAPAAPTNASSQKKSLASILRATAAQEYITQQLKTQFAALSGELAEKCNKCNTINPTDWKSNDCEQVCVPLEETASNNRGLFKKRNDLLKQLENVTTAQLMKILPDSKDRAFFYNKYFYERLKQSGSFEDSMIDMNDKLEEFINKVDDIHNEYASKDSALSSSTDERIKKNTKIQINYNKSPVEYYFKPTQETFDDLNSLSSSVSSLSDEQFYCKRKKWLSCAVRSHRCEWTGDRNAKFMCQPVANAPAASGQAPAASGQAAADPGQAAADPGQAPPVKSGGSRNISKQKKKIVRNLSKRRYF